MADISQSHPTTGTDEESVWPVVVALGGFWVLLAVAIWSYFVV